MTIASEARDLLPCPFCGHVPELRQTSQTPSWCVMCYNLKCEALPAAARKRHATQSEAIAAWNQRQKEAGRAEAMASLEIDGMRDVICALDGFMATGRRPRGAAWTRVARARTALANIRNGSALTPEPPSEKENEGG